MFAVFKGIDRCAQIADYYVQWEVHSRTGQVKRRLTSSPMKKSRFLEVQTVDALERYEVSQFGAGLAGELGFAPATLYR